VTWDVRLELLVRLGVILIKESLDVVDLDAGPLQPRDRSLPLRPRA
jgi:hypothetical protein